jgi:hypothetical protein
MRKSRKGGLGPAFVLASFSLFFLRPIAFPLSAQELTEIQEQAVSQSQEATQEASIAQEPAGSLNAEAGDKEGPWDLGLGIFFPLSGESLEGLEPEGLSLESLAAIAREAGEGSLSATIPGLLASHLEPLPPRFSAVPMKTPGTEESAETELKFLPKNQDERFFDPRSDRVSIDGLDGLVAGFYAESPQGLDLLLIYYEIGSSLPNRFIRQTLGIEKLERLQDIFLPKIFSWISGRALSVYDIQTGIFGTLRIEGRPGDDLTYSLQGSRIFLTEVGRRVFSLAAAGYQGRDIEIVNPAPYTYRRIQAPLKPLSDTNPAAAFSESSKTLAWEEEAAFNKARRRFSAALGRFLVSIPLTVLSAGNFISVQEAYTRHAKPASVYYGSAAFAGVSLALSLGFTVDTIVALVDLLRLSR